MFNLKPADVVLFWQAMQKEYDSTVVGKGNATEMKAVATLLDTIGVMDKENFLEDYATTFFDTVYIPFDIGVAGNWSFWAQVSVCVHEHVHVLQSATEGPMVYAAKYLGNPADRAKYEAEARGAQLELHFWRFGVIPKSLIEDYARGILKYNCGEEQVRFMLTYLEMQASLIEEEKASISPVAGFALEWLRQRNILIPDAPIATPIR